VRQVDLNRASTKAPVRADLEGPGKCVTVRKRTNKDVNVRRSDPGHVVGIVGARRLRCHYAKNVGAPHTGCWAIGGGSPTREFNCPRDGYLVDEWLSSSEKCLSAAKGFPDSFSKSLRIRPSRITSYGAGKRTRIERAFLGEN
jgi:hypothetical protein